jgi:uncharacterized protein
MRRLLRGALFLVFLALIITGWGYWNATRDPMVRTATLQVANWPVDAMSTKVLLISDTHVAGPDMPPERLRRILKQLNSLKPDLILLAGDYISEKRVSTRLYTPKELAAPFAELKAPLGVLAVMGNHDHWADVNAIALELQKNGVTVLDNSAARVGPLIIGGIDDEFTQHDNMAATFAAMDALEAAREPGLYPGPEPLPRILLTHGPDVVPDLPSPVAGVFTGHTHCGQIVLPVIGALGNVSRYGDRFACGDIKDKRPSGGSQQVYVSAGLGTSIVPIRFGAHPDVWLVTLGPL